MKPQPDKWAGKPALWETAFPKWNLPRLCLTRLSAQCTIGFRFEDIQVPPEG
jgi:hypothetical protein